MRLLKCHLIWKDRSEMRYYTVFFYFFFYHWLNVFKAKIEYRSISYDYYTNLLANHLPWYLHQNLILLCVFPVFCGQRLYQKIGTSLPYFRFSTSLLVPSKVSFSLSYTINLKMWLVFLKYMHLSLVIWQRTVKPNCLKISVSKFKLWSNGPIQRMELVWHCGFKWTGRG